jgi:tetratricopeptide (TPR) repeat protein
MKLVWYILLVTPAIAQQSELATGRDFYRAGEFKSAVAHFQLALNANPKDAASNYWMGRSYETLADISTPFGRKYRSLARTYLTTAAELAPNRPEYRRDLFDFLLDANQQRQASGILRAAAESDPDYEYMLSRLEQSRKVNSSVNGRVCSVFRVLTAVP